MSSLRVLDCHHHFWHPKDDNHPWLCRRPLIPFRYGDYSAICKPFMPPDYDEAAKEWQVVATVTMEGEWNPVDPVGELRWMHELRESSGRPQAHAAQIWLDRDDVSTVLEQTATFSFVRSLRQKPRVHDKPGQGLSSMNEPAFVDGFKQLSKYGLHFELQTPWWHLPEALDLARKDENTMLIINHTGLPGDRTPESLSGWEAALRELAVLPQARLKISGLGEPDSAFTLDANRDVILKAIDIFGADRCMFASNFPVDSLFVDFNSLYSTFDKITADFTDTERDQLFCSNAADVYRVALD